MVKAKDQRKANEWYKSCATVMVWHKITLAINYYYGKRVKRNLKEAYAWFAVARKW